jgi:regulatory protein
VYKKYYSKDEALQKIKAYCAMQERCHSEVKEKLYGYGLYNPDVENIIAHLIEENFLNEQRYASLYAGGHFRTKQWGRLKIRAGLQQKGVSKYNITYALNEIDEDDYLKTLQMLATKKAALLKGENALTKKFKLQNYLLQKGFEPGLIHSVIN